MARTDPGNGKMGATIFLVDLPDPAILLDRVLDTIDSSMPGGHSVLTIRNLRVPASSILGMPHEGLKYAQVRLSPARLSHCMRWLGGCIRANEMRPRMLAADTPLASRSSTMRASASC